MQRLDDRSRMSGDVHVRFCESLRGKFPRATRHVCSFQYREDLDKFLSVIALRLGKFNLELSAEKTRVIKFTRFETKQSEVFTFLGFEYRWGLSRKNNPLVKMRTAKKKFQLALSSMQSWMKLECCKLGTAGIMEKLRAKLQGHYNYYGVCGNIAMLNSFYQQTCQIVYKWLNRRSQRKSCNWSRFRDMLNYFSIPRPRIIGYWC
jgi:hypothetical protein